MYSEDESSKSMFSTFIGKSFTKDTLIRMCEKKRVKVAGPKDSVMGECLKLYTPTQLMTELVMVETLQWDEKLIIACLLSGKRTASQIINDNLTNYVLTKYGRNEFLSYEKGYLRRRIYRLKRNGAILESSSGREYLLNPLIGDYFGSVLGSHSAEPTDNTARQVSVILSRDADVSGYPLTKNATSQFIIKNVGGGTWSPGPFKTWVSKTDVTQFLRCQYRMFVMHSRNLALDELIDSSLIQSLLQKGREFEGNLISSMPFEEVANMESVMDKDVIYRSPDLIQNNELGIRGIVDLIQIARGELFPIEIKYHKDVTETDRIELAFYWKLLQPLRKGTPRPTGYILLNSGKITEITLTVEDFTRLEGLISEIRSVKEKGTKPAPCKECNVCNLYRNECLPQAREEGALGLIHGIGEARQKALTTLGIKDTQGLVGADASLLYQAWRRLTVYSPGLDEIRRMQIHARCFAEDKPIYFGSSRIPVGANLLILDLEYDNSECIWLLGLLASDGQSTKCYQFFADEATEEKKLLNTLNGFLEQHPRHLVLTWAGLCADIPELNSAWMRHGYSPEQLEDIKRRHFDLYNFFLHNCRLPLRSFGLKEVGSYFGFKRELIEMDGLQAQMLYHQYLKTPKLEKLERARIKQLLLEYNREDLEATLFVLNKLQSIAATQP